jgi:ABC-type nitrate/sulfonate/bicarbonate transport system ATPase subunit
MDGLLLEGLPGIPRQLRIDVGEQRALVVTNAAAARRVADVVAGLDEPPQGAVVKTSGEVRLVPAEGGLLPHLTVLGNVVHGHTVTHRVTRRAAADECRVTATRCGLEDVLERYPHEITPGRRRLAGVARALRAHPAVIVLEDAAGLPTWGSLLRFDHNPELWSAALLLITTDPARTTGFHHAE